jgi:murein DD-endopeptidase MepM/ murein hydrolase activator NlpD
MFQTPAFALVVVLAVLTAGCGAAVDSRGPRPVADDTAQAADCHGETACDRTRRPARAALPPFASGVAQASARLPAPTGQPSTVRAAPVRRPGGGRRFWVDDRRRYRSPWYAGAHRRMINFGCTQAPYYSPDPRCTRRRGFHHGLDIAMPCGTRLFSGLHGRVVDPGSAGSLGSAYGANAFRIRNHRYHVDIVIGHTRKVFVSPGERVRPGQRIALASDMGAPDGCHLHFEVRPPRGSVSQAVNPRERLRLRAVER